MTVKEAKETLVEGLRLIAAPTEVQIDSLPGYVDISYEVISAFTESFLQLPSIVESGELSNSSIAAILRCYNWLDYISRQESLLQSEVMKTHESWEKARLLAQKALSELGEKIQNPDLSHISFVEG